MSEPAIKVKVEVSKPAMDRVKARLRGAAERIHAHRVSVGIHEAEGVAAKKGYDGKDSGQTLAEVALQHEFGAGTLPDRSWLRTWVDMNEPRLRTEMKEVMRAEYEGNSEAVAKQAAVWAVELRDWIQLQQGQLEQLSDFTIARKTAAGLSDPDVPLLATGQLVKAIRALADGAEV